MADENYNYQQGTLFSAMGPIRRSFDVTPAPGKLQDTTRAIMVSESTTVTGHLVGDDAAEFHTTHTLEPGVMYPFMFDRITAVASGTVKAYY